MASLAKNTPVNGTPLAPSARLFGQMSTHADELRAQAKRDQGIATTEQAKADEATAKANALAAALEEARRLVEQRRAELEATLKLADLHGGKAQIHQQAAEDALRDAGWIDARLGRTLPGDRQDGQPAAPDPYRAPEMVARTDPAAAAAALDGLKRLDVRAGTKAADERDGGER